MFKRDITNSKPGEVDRTCLGSVMDDGAVVTTKWEGGLVTYITDYLNFS